jgi:hypothetical protein
MRGRGRVRCTGGGLRRVPQPSREPTPRPHLSPDRSRPGATPALRLAGPLPGLARDRSAVAAPGVRRNPANCEKAALSWRSCPQPGVLFPQRCPYSPDPRRWGDLLRRASPQSRAIIGRQGPQTRREQQLLNGRGQSDLSCAISAPPASARFRRRASRRRTKDETQGARPRAEPCNRRVARRRRR